MGRRVPNHFNWNIMPKFPWKTAQLTNFDEWYPLRGKTEDKSTIFIYDWSLSKCNQTSDNFFHLHGLYMATRVSVLGPLKKLNGINTFPQNSNLCRLFVLMFPLLRSIFSVHKRQKHFFAYCLAPRRIPKNRRDCKRDGRQFEANFILNALKKQLT